MCMQELAIQEAGLGHFCPISIQAWDEMGRGVKNMRTSLQLESERRRMMPRSIPSEAVNRMRETALVDTAT